MRLASIALITVTVLGIVTTGSPAQDQIPSCSLATSCAGSADAAKTSGAWCRSPVATRTTRPSACCAGFAPVTPGSEASSAPTARSGVVNDVCPACGRVVGDGGSAVRYNGFEVAVCGPACARGFRAKSSRQKDAFIGRTAEPVGGSCPISACCGVGPGSPVVTYKGTLFRVCCQACLNWWENADDAARYRVFTRGVADSVKAAARPALAIKTPGDDGTVDPVVLRIGGMTCQGCANAVEKSLAAVTGVREVGVSFDQGLAWVGLDAPGAASPQRLVKAVEDAGFSATRVAEAIERPEDRVAKPTGIASAPLVPIGDSLQPLIDRFNADKDKPRIVALLSPTCGGCIHGARAIMKEAVNAYPDEDFSVLVVWEPMLGSDSEAAAGESSAIFEDPRVHQFWDGGRLSGTAYSTQVFPDRFTKIAAAMPSDHPLSGRFRSMADVAPQRVPMWDFAAFYPAGIEWSDGPPRPEGFVRQLAIRMTPQGTSATMLTDDFAQAPIESDWFDEVRREMKTLLGPDARARASTGSAVAAATP